MGESEVFPAPRPTVPQRLKGWIGKQVKPYGPPDPIYYGSSGGDLSPIARTRDQHYEPLAEWVDKQYTPEQREELRDKLHMTDEELERAHEKAEEIDQKVIQDEKLPWVKDSEFGFSKPIHPDVIVKGQERANLRREEIYLMAARHDWLKDHHYPIPQELRETLSCLTSREKRIYEIEMQPEFPEIAPLTRWDHWQTSRRLEENRLRIDRRVKYNGAESIIKHTEPLIIDEKPSEENVFEEMAKIQLFPGTVSFDFSLKEMAELDIVPKEQYEILKRLTNGMDNFRMRVFVNEKFLANCGNQLSKAVTRCGTLIYGEGGWDSCLEVFGKDPAITARFVRDGIMVTYDMPGQNDSTFADPQVFHSDPFIHTHQGVTMAVDLVLKRIFGLDNEIIRGNKEKGILKKIEEFDAHSRRAAAQFEKGVEEIYDDDRTGHVLRDPVVKSKKLITFAKKKFNIDISNPLSVFQDFQLRTLGRLTEIGKDMPEPVKMTVADSLIWYLTRGASPWVQMLHHVVYKKTPAAVNSTTIHFLAEKYITKYADRIAFRCLRIIIGSEDPFTPNRHDLTQMLQDAEGDLIVTLPGGHYAFSDEPGMDPEDEKQNERNRWTVIRTKLKVLSECGYQFSAQNDVKTLLEDMLLACQILEHNPEILPAAFRCLYDLRVTVRNEQLEQLMRDTLRSPDIKNNILSQLKLLAEGETADKNT